MSRTTDISDLLHPEVQYLESGYLSYGLKNKFAGKIYTVKCFEDNSIVKEVLNHDGKGQVLVVDAGGSKRCAMLGDMLAELAIKNNWSGILIYGLIRDTDIINTMHIGVKALGTLPLKSQKRGVGQKDLIVSFSGVNFIPGEYIYSDEDGLIVVKNKVV